MGCDDEGRPIPIAESWYLETQDGFFFAVKGSEHPPDRWIAVLRYAPDAENGDRKKDGLYYRRLYHFAEQEQWILKNNPQYLAYDPVFQTTLQSVPMSAIKQFYDPSARFRELTRTSAGNAVEEDAVAFLLLLQKEAEVPPSCLGITGSLLIGLHTGKSDLDVVVFGEEYCRKVYRILQILLDADSAPDVTRLDALGMRELYDQRVVDTTMPYDDFGYLEARKVNQGFFRKRPYFIRFVKEAQPTEWRYGQRQYTALGRASITAVIADDRCAIFTPCRYFLSNASSLEQPLPADLNEAVSFRGRFCEQACTGETILASGVLERVLEGRQVHHRLLLGNFPEDTLVVRSGEESL
jgi:predicted nucleotidyltransferase